MRGLAAAALMGALVLATAPAPRADDYFEVVPPVAHKPTAKECGECHMAFQARLLPAESWRRIMDGLADHFGEDAGLAEDVAAEITAYLADNAGRRGDGTLLRITEQRWWLREHRKIAAATWNRPDVRAKSNCVACHKDAERGLYED